MYNFQHQNLYIKPEKKRQTEIRLFTGVEGTLN